MWKSMAKFIIIASAAFLSTAFFFSKPSIQFEKLEHDFGNVPEYSVQTCEFVFHNKGKGILIIEEVKAG